jgi:ribosomal protein L22
VPAQKKDGLFTRIRQGAQKGAVDRRPPPARVEREMQKAELEQGHGSLFEKALADLEAPTDSQSSSRIAKVWSEVSERALNVLRLLSFMLSTLDRITFILQHKTSTGLITTSPRKLNDVARLIQKKPIDWAILQAQMSDKRVAKGRVKSMLCLARDHAVAKGLDREKLIVRRAWVTKGVYLKRLDIKGRGRFGVKMRPEYVRTTQHIAELLRTNHFGYGRSADHVCMSF